MNQLLVLDRELVTAELISLHARHVGLQAMPLTGAALAHLTPSMAPEHALLLLGPTLPQEVVRHICEAWRSSERVRYRQTPILQWHLAQASQEVMSPALLMSGDPHSHVVMLSSMSDLMGHVNRLLRIDADDRPVRVGDDVRWHLELRSRRLVCGQESVTLGPTDFKLLEVLVASHEQALTRAQLIEQVWGTGGGIDSRTVDVHIKRLRDYLGKVHGAPVIETIRGIGYSLREAKSMPAKLSFTKRINTGTAQGGVRL